MGKSNKIDSQPIGEKVSDIYKIAYYILPDKEKENLKKQYGNGTK